MTGLFFALIPLVCPTAPGGVTTYTNQIAANTLFVAQWMFGIAFVVCVILLLVGKAARMHHLTQGAAVGLAVVLPGSPSTTALPPDPPNTASPSSRTTPPARGLSPPPSPTPASALRTPPPATPTDVGSPNSSTSPPEPT